MRQSGQTVTIADCPPVIREAIRRQVAGVYVQSLETLGISLTLDEVMAKFEVPDDENAPAAPDTRPSASVTPLRGRPRGSRNKNGATAGAAVDGAAASPADGSAGKDPTRVAAGRRAWATRQANGSVPKKKRRKSSTKKAAVDGDGLNRWQRGFNTRLERFKAKNPNMSDADARVVMMRGMNALPASRRAANTTKRGRAAAAA